jgi:hypothetical protein
MPDASSGQISSHSDLLHLTTLPANAVALIQTFLGYDVTAAIEQVRCPTLVLHTRGNSLIPFEEGRRIAALIPGAHFASLESQNHILVESEPAWQQCVDAIDDFLTAEPPRPILLPAGKGRPSAARNVAQTSASRSDLSQCLMCMSPSKSPARFRGRDNHLSHSRSYGLFAAKD